MQKFKNEAELVDHIETMHLQNVNGRESDKDLFRLGIEAAVTELMAVTIEIRPSSMIVSEVSVSDAILKAFNKANKIYKDKYRYMHINLKESEVFLFGHSKYAYESEPAEPIISISDLLKLPIDQMA